MPIRSPWEEPLSARSKALLAASRRFTAQGFAATTVRDIAADVGILSGSLFHHFSSKQEILRQAMRAVIEHALVERHERLQRASTLAERLRVLIEFELLANHDRSGRGFRVLVSEWRHLAPQHQREILALRDLHAEPWKIALHQAHEAGWSEADPDLLLQFLRGAIYHSHTWFDPLGRMKLPELTDQLFGAFFHPPGNSPTEPARGSAVAP
jgi:AcrR family transcriptional regulator